MAHRLEELAARVASEAADLQKLHDILNRQVRRVEYRDEELYGVLALLRLAWENCDTLRDLARWMKQLAAALPPELLALQRIDGEQGH